MHDLYLVFTAIIRLCTSVIQVGLSGLGVLVEVSNKAIEGIRQEK